MNFFNNKKFLLTQYLPLGLLRKWGKAREGQSQIAHTLIDMMIFFQAWQVWAAGHRATSLSSNFRQKLRLHNAQIPFASTVIIPKGLRTDSNRKFIPHSFISLHRKSTLIDGRDPGGHGICLSFSDGGTWGLLAIELIFLVVSNFYIKF
jgi:hypothetical protein